MSELLLLLAVHAFRIVLRHREESASMRCMSVLRGDVVTTRHNIEIVHLWAGMIAVLDCSRGLR